MNNMCKSLIAGLILTVTSTASATTIGMFTDGSTGNAASNINYVVTSGNLTPGDGADSWQALTSASFNGMSTAQLLAAYDTIIFPWLVNTSANTDWSSVLLPYLNGGGRILWEDPNNINELSASGISLAGGNAYGAMGEGDISLVSPFGDGGASGYYHIHYSILAASADWRVWSSDINGKIHGVYKEFNNGGRMVLGVSDNLYHPTFSNPLESDHFALTVNQLNWLNTGSVTGTPSEVPQPASVALLGLGIAGLCWSRRRQSK